VAPSHCRAAGRLLAQEQSLSACKLYPPGPTESFGDFTVGAKQTVEFFLGGLDEFFIVASPQVSVSCRCMQPAGSRACGASPSLGVVLNKIPYVVLMYISCI
jgi:hypothetical protein